MGVWGLIVLGVVQGLSEFLPISSSGHLLLLGKIFGIEDSLFVSIFLHMATLLAVVIVFRKEIWFMITHPLSKQSIYLCTATIPTCMIALILMPWVKKSFGGEFLYLSFFISGIILMFVEFYTKKHKNGEFSMKNALIMGVAQGFAIFPGISRSGTTISAGLLSGGEKEECGKFSFLLSLPIILASMLGEVIEICREGQTLHVNGLGLILGFLSAFLLGLATIKFMMKLTQKGGFMWISGYLMLMTVIAKMIM